MSPSILHAFNLYGNPSEVWSYRMMQGLHQLGVSQGVVTAQYWKGNYEDLPWNIYSLPFWSDYSNNNHLRRRISYWLTPRKIPRDLKNKSWDLVHAHFGPAGWRYLPLADQLGVPLVVSFYGTDYQALPNKRPIWKKRYQTLFQKAACVLTEGQHGVDLLTNMGCPSEKIQMQRLGVHLGVEPANKRSKQSGQLRLVQVASFVEKKGQADTIRAFAMALRHIEHARLTLAGDGKANRAKLQKLAADLGVSERIDFLNFVPYAELRHFLSDFDVFIHPSKHTSKDDNEGGIPTILFEAMAAGLPVVSTYHCDIPTLVLHRKNGLLANEGDCETLSTYIQAFYEMEESAMNAFRKAARSHVAAAFNIKDAAQQLLGVYNSIIRSNQ